MKKHCEVREKIDILNQIGQQMSMLDLSAENVFFRLTNAARKKYLAYCERDASIVCAVCTMYAPESKHANPIAKEGF